MRDEKAEFAEWYAKFPRKVGRKAAFAAWMDARFVRPVLVEMIAASARYIEFTNALRERRGWAPDWKMPATWLRGEHWTDEFDAPACVHSVALVPDQAAMHAETAARMAHARADAAWLEVVSARRARSMPLGGFQDARCGQVLAAIGGWTALDAALSRPQMETLRREFLAAYALEAPSSGNVVALRTAHG